MLNERNKRNKERKNKVMGRTPKTPPRELANREVHDHGSNAETVGRFRGVPKAEQEQENSHTVYHDMGYLMAESLGLVSETTRKDTYGGSGPDKMSRLHLEENLKNLNTTAKKNLRVI